MRLITFLIPLQDMLEKVISCRNLYQANGDDICFLSFRQKWRCTNRWLQKGPARHDVEPSNSQKGIFCSHFCGGPQSSAARVALRDAFLLWRVCAKSGGDDGHGGAGGALRGSGGASPIFSQSAARCCYDTLKALKPRTTISISSLKPTLEFEIRVRAIVLASGIREQALLGLFFVTHAV